MDHYNIFRKELARQFPTFGHALWEPSPGVLSPRVEIGDVGFVRLGRFQRLFSALLPADHPSHQHLGVPEYHEPLQLNLQPHIDTRILTPQNFCSGEVMVAPGGQGVYALGPEPEPISFSCKGQGAVLSLPVPARSHDALAQGDFGRWIVTHIDLWFAFTQRLGLGIKRMEDIILVTGCDLTRSWANIAFLRGRGEAQVSFGVQVTDVQGTDVPNIEWQFPPEERQRVALNLGPNGENLPEDQCIFIRGFRVTRLLGILPRIRAAAGPSQNPDQDEPDLDMQLFNAADTNYQDPLHKLLENIAMKAPDCDMILVHDDDLMRIDNAPNTVIGRPRGAMPEVQQVECGGSEARIPILKVATLSKNPFGTPENVSRPLAAPAPHIPSPSDKAGDRFSPPPTDMHADRDRAGPLTTPFDEPGPSSHAPRDDNTKAQPMKQTKPFANTRKYNATTKAQSKGRGTSLRWKLPRKVVGLTRPVKALYDPRRRLHATSAEGYMESRHALFDDGMHASAKDKDGLSPLHRALCQGLPRVALTLLGRGADVTAPDNKGRAPLHWASSEGHLEVLLVLLGRGADTKVRNNDGCSSLYLEVEKRDAKVALVLLGHGADATARDKEGKTALHWAPSGGHMRATHALLDCGADTTAQDKNGWTPLHLTIFRGHEEVALVHLESCADTTARDEQGKTPLHWALPRTDTGVIRALLDRGADARAASGQG